MNSILSFTRPDDHPFNFIKLTNDKKIKFNVIKYQGKKYSQFERDSGLARGICCIISFENIEKKIFF